MRTGVRLPPPPSNINKINSLSFIMFTKSLYSTSYLYLAGLVLGDVELMGKGISDSVIEPARSSLIKGLDYVNKRVIEAGASGFAISGSGPSVIALVNSNRVKVNKVAFVMKNAFEKFGVKSHTICTKPGIGARISRKS